MSHRLRQLAPPPLPPRPTELAAPGLQRPPAPSPQPSLNESFSMETNAAEADAHAHARAHLMQVIAGAASRTDASRSRLAPHVDAPRETKPDVSEVNVFSARQQRRDVTPQQQQQQQHAQSFNRAARVQPIKKRKLYLSPASTSQDAPARALAQRHKSFQQHDSTARRHLRVPVHHRRATSFDENEDVLGQLSEPSRDVNSNLTQPTHAGKHTDDAHVRATTASIQPTSHAATTVNNIAVIITSQNNAQDSLEARVARDQPLTVEAKTGRENIGASKRSVPPLRSWRIPSLPSKDGSTRALSRQNTTREHASVTSLAPPVIHARSHSHESSLIDFRRHTTHEISPLVAGDPFLQRVERAQSLQPPPLPERTYQLNSGDQHAEPSLSGPYETLPDVAEESAVDAVDAPERLSRRDVMSHARSEVVEAHQLQEQPPIFFKPGQSRRFSREPSLDRPHDAATDDVKDPVYDVIPANDVTIVVEEAVRSEGSEEEEKVELERDDVVGEVKDDGGKLRAVGIGEYSARKFELSRRQSSPMMLPSDAGSTLTLNQGQGHTPEAFQRNSRLSRSEKNIASLLNGGADVSAGQVRVASGGFGRSMSMRVPNALARSRASRPTEEGEVALSAHHVAKLSRLDANISDDVMKLLQDQLECETAVVFELASLALQAAVGDYHE